MTRKLVLFSCLLALASIPAFGTPISFSGSGSSGTVLGMPFAYNADFSSGGTCPGCVPDWGIPGVFRGNAAWTGSVTATDFEITFNLPSGTAIAGNTFATNCNFFGCSTFWTPDLISSNTIDFVAPPGPGNALTPGASFFVNIFFSGTDPNGASFNGNFSVPEPASLLLLGTGLLGLAGALRRRKKLLR